MFVANTKFPYWVNRSSCTNYVQKKNFTNIRRETLYFSLQNAWWPRYYSEMRLFVGDLLILNMSHFMHISSRDLMSYQSRPTSYCTVCGAKSCDLESGETALAMPLPLVAKKSWFPSLPVFLEVSSTWFCILFWVGSVAGLQKRQSTGATAEIGCVYDEN